LWIKSGICFPKNKDVGKKICIKRAYLLEWQKSRTKWRALKKSFTKVNSFKSLRKQYFTVIPGSFLV
jgi:hypothetical protein